MRNCPFRYTGSLPAPGRHPPSSGSLFFTHSSIGAVKPANESGTLLECIASFIDHCIQRKKAILHIYRSVFREYFINELDRIALYIVAQYIDTVRTNQPLSPEDRALLIRFYKCLFTGICMDWLNDGMQYDLSHYVDRIGVLFQGAPERAYQTAVQSSPKQGAVGK